jgi:hypothetical protein
MKTSFLILGVLFGLATSSTAQTNFTIVTRTNIVQAAPNFREVNGQLYNLSFSQLWTVQTGKILAVQPEGIVLQTYTNEPIYEQVYHPATANQAVGAYSDGPVGWQKRKVGDNKIELKRVFIRHYRIGAVDQEISIPAMKTGTVQIGGNVLEAWDIGLPHFVTNIVSSKVKEKLSAP